MIVAEYIKTLQSYEEYAFSWEEVLEKCNAPESTIRKELVRLAKKNEIVNYTIIQKFNYVKNVKNVLFQNYVVVAML